MFRSVKLFKSAISLVIFLLLCSAVFAQKKSKKSPPTGKPVMWEQVNIGQRNLFLGPGGTAMQPDLSKITFIKEEKEGYNKKYRIKDGSGRVWVAKLGREAQPETAAVRFLWALGYKTEINYLVPSITIPGKGTFTNVRLEARPENVKRLETWKWKNNPFINTKEFQGLKIMMVFLNNWDIVDVQNKMLLVETKNSKELQYIISDLGATFGKLGNNNLPLFYRFGRSISNPSHYIKSSFIKEVEDGKVELAYKGKNRSIFRNITVGQARWLANLLLQLSDKQIEDAFRAANYSPADLKTFKQAVKNRIAALDDATTQNLAKN